MSVTEKGLRIAILAHALRAGGGISVGRNMISTLSGIGPNHEYFVSYPSGLGYEEVISRVTECRTCVFDSRGSLFRRWIKERFELKPALKRFNPHIILGLGNKGIGGFKCPQAILCHNAYIWYSWTNYGHYRWDELISICLKTLIQRLLLRRDLSRTQNVLLYQTETARARIKNSLGSRAMDVYCPNALSEYLGRSNGTVPEKAKKYHGLYKLLYVTRYYPHKNIEALVELFRRYPEALADTVAFITIEAGQHPGARRLLRKIERYKLANRVVNVGPVPQEELGAWFEYCDAVVMPTLLESFSGSYLEAMYYARPILTSDLDFAREICGHAALYFDPRDYEAMKNAILKIKEDVSCYGLLVEAGKCRLAEKYAYRWEDIARMMLTKLEQHVRTFQGKLR